MAVLQHRIAQAELQAALTKGRPVEGRARYPMRPEALALSHYNRRLAFDDALRERTWYRHLGDIDDGMVAQLRAGIAGLLDDDALHEVIGDQVERFQRLGNLDVEKGTSAWRAAARALCVGELEALARVVERDAGNFAGVPEHPMLAKAEEEPEPLPPASLRGLFQDYLKARAAVGRGHSIERRWRSVIESLIKHSKTHDARKLTKADILAWRDKLLEDGLSATTVSGVHVAAIKAILRWAHENDRLPSNVAEGVRQAKAKTPQTREKGYTDDEARELLKAARTYRRKVAHSTSTTESDELVRAKRWVPWLCAFSGARVTEITQLRGRDLREEHGGWVMRITPDAGSVKTGTFRDVPLHPQPVELGLIELVHQVGDGPLFSREGVGHDGKPRDPLKAARAVSGRLSEWIGGLKVAQDVAPNHAWRHRFKSQAMDLGLSQRVVDAIQGHAGRTASDGYGDVSLLAKRKAVETFPIYEVA